MITVMMKTMLAMATMMMTTVTRMPMMAIVTTDSAVSALAAAITMTNCC